ncbi:MAG: tRNA (cytidine(34)-2'-O)-methyltransferase [Planctomycetota bacterium]|nr:tRNA (cytidine(34)-2'-O)-methyltransferase [Planctomycetota bacterium]
MTDPLFHVVLHEPEIPNNTGNIGRTCVATGCALHLIHPLGFQTSEKACRRAGLDYWPRLGVVEHASFRAYQSAFPASGAWFFSTKGTASLFDAEFQLHDHLVFGKETAGLPDAILIAVPPERVLRMPMVEGERSLNVATAVCAAVYEALRQVVARGQVRVDSGVIRRPS